MQAQNRFSAMNVDIDTLVKCINEDGYVIIENLIDQKQLSQLNEEVKQQLAKTYPDSENSFMGDATKRFGRLLHTVPASRELACNPVVTQVLDKTLLKLSPTYQLHFTGVMHVMAGAKQQFLHRDQTPFPNPGPLVVVACMWALSDFKRENGGTVIVPRSHRWPDMWHPSREDLMAVEMPAGSVLMYAGNLIHGAGKSTAGYRTGMAFQYTLGWLRQEENQYLAVPIEEARTFDIKLQKLMGYDLAAKHWGYVGQVHPLNFLNNINEQGNLDPAGYEFDNNIQKIEAKVLDTKHHHAYYEVSLDDR